MIFPSEEQSGLGRLRASFYFLEWMLEHCLRVGHRNEFLVPWQKKHHQY